MGKPNVDKGILDALFILHNVTVQMNTVIEKLNVTDENKIGHTAINYFNAGRCDAIQDIIALFAGEDVNVISETYSELGVEHGNDEVISLVTDDE